MDSNLIYVTKDGDALEVHPSCLAAHLAVGWVQCEKPESKGPEQPARKRGRKASEETDESKQ